MSLATRCTACGTVFRVVQDQLKVSEGWVRCGRCNEVFNALEGLFDLDRDSAPGWTPSQRGALEALPGHAPEPDIPLDIPAAPADLVADRESPGIAQPSPPDVEVDTRVDSQLETQQVALDEDDTDDGADPLAAAGTSVGTDAAIVDEGERPADGVAPAFLREAERAARWRRPHVRLALTATAALAGMLLAAQVVVYHRDALAARWPQAAPVLAMLCESIDCRIEPLRHLESLSVESSGLTQLDQASHYRLQVTLRNRNPMPLMAPALDVTLTDSRGDVVARKVLGRAEFGAAAPMQLAAGAELTLAAVLDTGDQRVTGYSVEIFYP
jgi:predicted Zn finger-like uncharacterized protein